MPTGGIVSGFFAFDSQGTQLLSVTDLSFSLRFLTRALQSGGPDALGTVLSSGRDSFVGSVNDDVMFGGASRDVIRGGRAMIRLAAAPEMT